MQKYKDLYEKIDKLYQDKKSRNFVLHLIKSYMPLSNVHKVFVKPVDMKNFRCVITNNKLISVDEIFEIINSEEYKESFIDDLKYNIGLQKDSEDNKESSIVKFTDNRIIGYQGKSTTTYMCQVAIECLHEWVKIKILKGDKTINWTLNKALGHKPKHKKRKNDFYYKESTSTTLGDLDSLKQVKSKFKND